MVKSLDKVKEGFSLINNNKVILFEESYKIDELKKKIKTNINPPKKDIKVYVIGIVKPKSKKNTLMAICNKYTITPDLNLKLKDNDVQFFQTITWSQEEFDKYGLKKSDILKIIKAIKYDLISLEDDYVSISEVIKNTNKLEKKK
jgi:hypothetical protein